MKSRRLAALLFSLAALASQALAQPAAPLPAEAFFSSPKFGMAHLSPDGRWLAASSAIPGRRIGLSIIDLDGKEGTRFIEASPKDDVNEFHWVGSDWLVISLNSPEDRGADYVGEGLMAVRRDGSASRMLIDRNFVEEDTFKRRRVLDPTHAFVRVGAPGTTEVVISQAQFREREFSHRVLKVLDITTSAVRSMPGDLPRAKDWLVDAKGRPRVAWQEDRGMTIQWWADAKGQWKELSKAPSYEQLFSARAVDGDDGLIVSTGASTDGSLQLRRFDFQAAKAAPEPLLATPGFSDYEYAVVDTASGAVRGVVVTTDAATPVWFDEKARQLQARVDAKLPGRVNLLHCWVCDGTARVVVVSYSDTDPGTIVLYTPQDDKLKLIGQSRPEIDSRQMAQQELHRTQARDGRDLPVWVTRKPAGPGAKSAPAVVLVHGGPFERGTEWRFNPEPQFLASRGYVVIEPEFRGSRGYGYDHFRAGWKQWGQGMQDDITDALRFAIKQGWVDKDRVCIMGASFGGYAALWGLAKDPEQYRCGVAFAAVSDPRFMYDFHWNDIGKESRDFNLPLMLGDRVKDAAMLAANSPLEHASRIKAPVLLAHGHRDRRVPIENAERMRDALRRNGTPLEWVVFDEEFHGFFYDKNRIEYYRRVEAFLAKHLKP